MKEVDFEGEKGFGKTETGGPVKETFQTGEGIRNTGSL